MTLAIQNDGIKKKGDMMIIAKGDGERTLEKETRTYKITGEPEQLNTLEWLFEQIEYLGNVGSSRLQEIYVDGDGAVHLKIRNENGEKLEPSKDIGCGYITTLDKDSSYHYDLG